MRTFLLPKYFTAEELKRVGCTDCESHSLWKVVGGNFGEEVEGADVAIPTGSERNHEEDEIVERGEASSKMTRRRASFRNETGGDNFEMQRLGSRNRAVSRRSTSRGGRS